MKRLVLLAAAAMSLPATGAQAQEKLKIGIIATLSGPPAVLGQQLRNGFNLAVKTLDGKLGGRDVEVIVADDELKPDVAVAKVKDRQRVQPEFLRHLLPERSGVRGVRQTCPGERDQEGVPDGAELPGGQGRARRIQGFLPGRDRR